MRQLQPNDFLPYFYNLENTPMRGREDFLALASHPGFDIDVLEQAWADLGPEHRAAIRQGHSDTFNWPSETEVANLRSARQPLAMNVIQGQPQISNQGFEYLQDHNLTPWTSRLDDIQINPPESAAVVSKPTGSVNYPATMIQAAGSGTVDPATMIQSAASGRMTAPSMDAGFTTLTGVPDFQSTGGQNYPPTPDPWVTVPPGQATQSSFSTGTNSMPINTALGSIATDLAADAAVETGINATQGARGVARKLPRPGRTEAHARRLAGKGIDLASRTFPSKAGAIASAAPAITKGARFIGRAAPFVSAGMTALDVINQSQDTMSDPSRDMGGQLVGNALGTAAGLALSFIPVVGPLGAAIATPFLAKAGGDIGRRINLIPDMQSDEKLMLEAQRAYQAGDVEKGMRIQGMLLDRGRSPEFMSSNSPFSSDYINQRYRQADIMADQAQARRIGAEIARMQAMDGAYASSFHAYPSIIGQLMR